MKPGANSYSYVMVFLEIGVLSSSPGTGPMGSGGGGGEAALEPGAGTVDLMFAFVVLDCFQLRCLRLVS